MRLHFHPVHSTRERGRTCYVAASGGTASRPADDTPAYVIRHSKAVRRTPLPIPTYDINDPDGYPVDTDLTLRQAMLAAEANAAARALLPHVSGAAFAKVKCVNHSLAAARRPTR